MTEVFVKGDLVEPNDEAKKSFKFPKDIILPWVVVRVSNCSPSSPEVTLQRTNRKTGNKYTTVWAASWLKKVGHREIDLTPLEQFKLDCHDILKRLDCYGDDSEVAYFVGALRAYETAKAASKGGN